MIAALLAALFLLPRFGLAALVALVIAGAAYEWARLCRLRSELAWAYAMVLAGLFCALLLVPGSAQAVFALACIFWLIAAPLWLARGVRADHALALAVSGLLVLVPAALAMVSLKPAEVLAILVLVWIADSAAYFVGRNWGSRKLAPRVSPGKTWEGAAGGVAGAAAYAIILSVLVEGRFRVVYVAAAALLAVVSIVGDLFESALKRQAAVKDSGALLPGHGGILDRLDSTTSTLPLAAVLARWMAS